jgi:hypothetical protein
MVMFFEKTSIAKYSALADQNLREAFETARSQETVCSWDRRLLDSNHANELGAVNHYSRQIWGEAISQQFASRFCHPGKYDKEVQPAFLVTLCDTTCITAVADGNVDIGEFKSRLRTGLCGLSYLGALEPAYYSHVALGAEVMARTFVAWHLHVIAWGSSRRSLQLRLEFLNASGRYRPVAEGLSGVDCRKIKEGDLAKIVGYVFKPPGAGYRLARTSDQQGRLVLAGFTQRLSKLRPGERINLFHAMKYIPLDRLAAAGGEGVEMLAKAKRMCGRFGNA